MTGMFSNCRTFNQPLYNWDVSNVVFMDEMFLNAFVFNQSLYAWNMQFENTIPINVTKSNTTTLNMFNSTSLLNYYVVSGNVLQTTINDAIDTFTNNRAIYDKIFRPIDELDTTQLSNLNGLFKNNTTFNEYIGSWNVSNVIYMEETFMGATSFNRRISKWNISNVINMSNMFNGASSFKKSLVNWTNFI